MGSGGSIRLVSPTVGGGGSLLAGAGENPQFPGECGGSGGVGRIRVEALEVSGFGATVGDTRIVTLSPTTPLIPDPFPQLRVVRVAGMDVPASPSGSFSTVDVTFDSQAEVTIEIEASNIPEGTTVELTIWNETEGTQTLTSTPLAAGDPLTATATATIPSGFSRIFSNATWGPPPE